MPKNHWNALKIVYLVKLLRKRSATLSSENLENKSNFEGWDLTPVAYEKSVIVLYKKKYLTSEN